MHCFYDMKFIVTLKTIIHSCIEHFTSFQEYSAEVIDAGKCVFL